MRVVEGRGEIEDVDEVIARLGAVGEEFRCSIAAFDGRYVVSREHVDRAVELADRAFRRGENVADARAIEILLYAAGRRQIDRAIEMGVSAGEGPIVVAIDAEPNSDDGTPEADPPNGEASTDASDPADGREKQAATAVRGVLPGFVPADVLGEYEDATVREFFGITAAELAATDATVPELVLERVVLLDVEK